jgi:glycerol kinase
MLMNLKTLKWDTELLKLFKVPIGALPEIKPSSGYFGSTYQAGFVSDNTTITGVAGDQQAALFGQTCFNMGEGKCTFGTGSFILMNSGTKIIKSKFNLLTTVAWKIKDKPAQYALEGGAFVCGAAVQWLRDGLGLISHSHEVESLAAAVQNTEGVEFVPALTGLAAPYWQPEARGELTGLTRGTTKNHIARATLEAMALQNADIVSAMQKDLGKKIKKLRVDGGASANNLLMQLQANYLQTQVDRPQQIETTSMGAAYLAGLGADIWKSTNEITQIWRIDRSFKSQMTSQELSIRKKSWMRAMAKVLVKS